MPNGHSNGGPYGGGHPPTPPGASLPSPGTGGGGTMGTATASFDKTKSIAYGTTDQIYSAASDAAVDAPSGALPTTIEVANTGPVPLMLLVGYESYEAEDDADGGATKYLHTMLMPGEIWYPSVRAVISTTNATAQFDGTALSNQVPSVTANFAYAVSGTTIDDAGFEAADTTITVDDGDYFRVNDLIQFGINTSATTRIEICRVTDISTNVLTLERALYGTLANDKDSENHGTSGVVDNATVYFPFFNAYHDYDKYTVAQTDENGKFKCYNFFGLGRASAAAAAMGIVPGSFAIKFYNAGYQSLGLSGITSSTETSLEASGSYWFKIAIDGGTAESINFTVDTSNTRWGGTNGVLNKINEALEAKYNNTASNTFQQKSSVAIVNGDVRFTSGQRLSTSAIALTAGVDGASAAYNLFAQQNGWVPALANVPDAVAARLPDDVVYDRITYAQTPNSGIFGYDDGRGNLYGMCSGTINYETGALDMTGCPVNAEFVYSIAHTSVFGGKVNTGANAVIEILANTPAQKWNGSVRIRTWEEDVTHRSYPRPTRLQ